MPTVIGSVAESRHTTKNRQTKIREGMTIRAPIVAHTYRSLTTRLPLTPKSTKSGAKPTSTAQSRQRPSCSRSSPFGNNSERKVRFSALSSVASLECRGASRPGFTSVHQLSIRLTDAVGRCGCDTAVLVTFAYRDAMLCWCDSNSQPLNAPFKPLGNYLKMRGCFPDGLLRLPFRLPR